MEEDKKQVGAPKAFLVWLGVMLVVLVYQGSRFLPNTGAIKDTGPVTIAKADYDYHQIFRFPSGEQFEFYHCAVSSKLFEKDSIVRIRYRGDGRTMSTCADIVSLEIIKSSEIDKEAATRFAQAEIAKRGYTGINVFEEKGENKAIEANRHLSECDYAWHADDRNGYARGVICRDTNNQPVIVETDHLKPY